MTDTPTLPEPPDLAATVFAALKDKAHLANGPRMMLGVLAGVYIGLGGLFAIIALAGAEAMPFGVGQVLAGLVFAMGLALVMIGGAELFTGNTLMAGPVAAGEVAPGRAAAALAVVYAANFAGSVLLALLVLAAGLHEAGEGAVGRAALDLGATKTDQGFGAMLASGILANMLVCLAVWLAYGGKTVTQKLAGLTLPIAAFVAAGFEHSVANMYLLPYAWMVQAVTEGAGAAITASGVLANLVAATIGNLIGGAAIALAYWFAYLRD
ncbi:formate/nitrite transporter family protein [Paracoccus sp. (in: a-proteobacteria)]|uniref:formate/nitrite transporter family protein n=1 Tax=Paracoccus sp. TaxID=267 RepID=UPI00272A3F69|nr:formate/nitrite transporter family protein [Paracoccus sp. (in: a-proteobacteria)]